MSNSDEPKDCSQPLTASQENLEENKKALNVTLSIQWIKDVQPDRRKFNLETIFQTWASNHKNAGEGRLTCEVLTVSEDGSVVQLSIKPPPDVSELEALKGRTLTRKDVNMLKVTSVSWDGDNAQTPQDGVMKALPPLPSEPQHERAPMNETGCSGPPAAVLTAENKYVLLAVDMFLTLSGTEEVRRIGKRHNCVMEAKVKVEFVKVEGEGDPQKALSEFKAFVHTLVGAPQASGHPHPEELDMPTRIDKPELAKSSLEQHKPSQSKKTAEVFSSGARSVEGLKASSWTSQPTAGDVKMDIDEPLFSDGITIEKSCWTLMTVTYGGHLLKVQRKFNVYFEAEHLVDQDKVRIRVAGGRNAALESHAIRAFSHLYKRIVTSPITTNQPGGATGFTSPDPPKNGPNQDRGEPLLTSQSGDSTVTEKAMAGGGDHKEDNCPICLDTLEDKMQLSCKHEFCRGCLDRSVNSLGPCCPLCKHVFGTMVGNQPEGKMTSTVISKRLPGFPRCQTIVITYNIPGGIQTEKHPNPGKPFHGAQRTAYLPNNKEGKEVLQLLQKAFDQKLIFTVGQSRTTSMENQVTWNDIHHKTSMDAGPAGFGYPDPDYLERVRDELKAKGIE